MSFLEIEIISQEIAYHSYRTLIKIQNVTKGHNFAYPCKVKTRNDEILTYFPLIVKGIGEDGLIFMKLSLKKVVVIINHFITEGREPFVHENNDKFFGNNIVVLDENMKFYRDACRVRGIPKPTVKWYKVTQNIKDICII